MSSKLFFTIVEYVTFVACVAIFFCLMLDTGAKYYNKATTTNTKYEDDRAGGTTPCITFCPWQAYKDRGFYFDEETYLDKTFRGDDTQSI